MYPWKHFEESQKNTGRRGECGDDVWRLGRRTSVAESRVFTLLGLLGFTLLGALGADGALLGIGGGAGPDGALGADGGIGGGAGPALWGTPLAITNGMAGALFMP